VTVTNNSIRVPLELLEAPRGQGPRQREPITIGVPLPRGRAYSPEHLGLEAHDGSVRPLQSRELDRWGDGSIRWALLDFQADAMDGELSPLTLVIGEAARGARPAFPLDVADVPGGIDVTTGPVTFSARRGGSFPFSSVAIDGAGALDAEPSGFRVKLGDRVASFVPDTIHVRERGPLRVELEIACATARDLSTDIEVVARVELFANSALARIALTLRNRRPARHADGIWELGDPGSLFLESAVIALTVPGVFADLHVAAEPLELPEPMGTPFELYQDSSGGAAWDHPTHVTRHGRVPMTFRGYRLRGAATERMGLRAAPTVTLGTDRSRIAVAVPRFWQNFPRAVNVSGGTIEVGLFPSQAAHAHELQGGEQKTHVVVVDFHASPASERSLEWCHEPLRIYAPADWCSTTGAVPLLGHVVDDDVRYQRLVALALSQDVGFQAKRELADEYGWRHFGDLPADHESAFQAGATPLVSHYNNQYDAIAAFAAHFLRTGDVRWWTLMDELALHVRDIDIYHTAEDKPAYNGGLFWHTQHYVDAGRSTHRTYPAGSGGGGPSAEHNYAHGLMLHYFLTGQAASREAVLGLGQWVRDMDDGGRSPFRWLAAGPTGFASATGSLAYHGPGRGAANSILACAAAHRLSGDPAFSSKAEELIQRCIHPLDDVDARNLLDVERRWYYTVFLQALGMYLLDKAERGERDAMYAYAQKSLLRYARWMAEHEVPYLSRPEVLEYPTETWAAQDLRKAEALLFAAACSQEPDRSRFRARAAAFFDHAIETLLGMPTARYTRPLVLVLGLGYRYGSLYAGRVQLPESGELPDVGLPLAFESSKTVAIRRARWMAALFVALAAGSLMVWLL
jgi:hypothetical protein